MLKEFLAVAKTVENGFGSFIQAADELSIHPSTLSKHIKLLEDELGAPLFDRTTRRVALNDFGHFFMLHAKEMYDGYMECQTAVSQYILPRPPVLCFGTVVPVAAENRCMRAMRVCEKRYPGCSFQMAEFDNWTLKELLRSGKHEFIIAYEEKDNNPEITARPFGQDKLIALIMDGHPLCGETHLSLDMLKKENIITSPRSSYVGNLIHKACRAAGFSPQVWYSDNSASNLAAVVDHGGGVGLMMESSARYLAGPHTKLIPLEPTITLQLCTFTLRERKLSPIATTFLAELRQMDDMAPVPKGADHDH